MDHAGRFHRAGQSRQSGRDADQAARREGDKAVGGKSKLIQARPLPVDDPKQRCPDITLARDKLRWEPKVPLEQGLAKTIEYFDGLLRGNQQVSRVGR